MGAAHLRLFANMAKCQVVGACDIDRSKRAIADKYSIQFFESPGELLGNDLEAISICTPPSQHFLIAMAALEKGLDVLVEKPLASNIVDGEALVKRARKTGRLLTVGYLERFNPAITRALESTALDEIYSTVSYRLGPMPPQVRDIGVLFDLATHEIDTLLYIFGREPEVTYCYTRNLQNNSHEDYARLSLSFGDVHSHIETSWLPSYKLRTLWMYGTRNFYSIDYALQRVSEFRSPPKFTIESGNWLDTLWLSRNIERELVVEEKEPLSLELEAFLKSIEKGSLLKPLCTAEEALIVLKIAKQALDFASSGKVALIKTESLL